MPDTGELLDCGGSWCGKCFLRVRFTQDRNICPTPELDARSIPSVEYSRCLLSMSQEYGGPYSMAGNLSQENLATQVSDIRPLRVTICSSAIGEIG